MTILLAIAGVYLAGAVLAAAFWAGVYGPYAGRFAGVILREAITWPLTLLDRLFP